MCQRYAQSLLVRFCSYLWGGVIDVELYLPDASILL